MIGTAHEGPLNRAPERRWTSRWGALANRCGVSFARLLLVGGLSFLVLLGLPCRRIHFAKHPHFVTGMLSNTLRSEVDFGSPNGADISEDRNALVPPNVDFGSPSDADIRLSVTTTKTQYEIGEPVVIQIRVENLNPRFTGIWGSEPAFGPSKWFGIEALTSSGHAVKRTDLNAGKLFDGSFRTLNIAFGASIGESLELSEFFDLSRIGSYEVRVNCLIAEKGVGWADAETARSDPIHFEIVNRASATSEN